MATRYRTQEQIDWSICVLRRNPELTNEQLSKRFLIASREIAILRLAAGVPVPPREMSDRAMTRRLEGRPQKRRYLFGRLAKAKA